MLLWVQRQIVIAMVWSELYHRIPINNNQCTGAFEYYAVCSCLLKDAPMLERAAQQPDPYS